MFDPLTWSVRLGRWGGTTFRVHFTFMVLVVLELLGEMLSRRPSPLAALGWVGLLTLAVLVHVAVQVFTAARLGLEPDEVRLWPVGQLMLPGPGGSRGLGLAVAAAAGPLISLLIAIILAIVLQIAGARMILNPFGMPRIDVLDLPAPAKTEPPANPAPAPTPAPAAPRDAPDPAAEAAPTAAQSASPRGPVVRADERAQPEPPLPAARAGPASPTGRLAFGGGTPIRDDGSEFPISSPIWWLGWFGYLSWVLCLLNFIPALPLAGGRIFRALVGPGWESRDHAIVPHTARACAIVLGVVGIIRWIQPHKPGGVELIVLALIIDSIVRFEARWLEERGYYDETVFGYDFSQGYTSLEAQTPRVRPTRESALKRWRRKRSEQRRLRQAARQAAELQRLDEILEKLHREGREALSVEEQRFLHRVSSRLRSKPRQRKSADPD